MATQNKNQLKNKANATLTKKYKFFNEKTAKSGQLYYTYTGQLQIKGWSASKVAQLKKDIVGDSKKFKDKYPKNQAQFLREYKSEKEKYTNYKKEYDKAMSNIDKGLEPFEEEKKKEDKPTNVNSKETEVPKEPETPKGTPKKEDNIIVKQYKKNKQRAADKKKAEFEEAKTKIEEEFFGIYKDLSKISDGDVLYDPRDGKVIWKGKSDEAQSILTANFKNCTKDEFVKKYVNSKFFPNNKQGAEEFYNKLVKAKENGNELKRKYDIKIKALADDFEVSDYKEIGEGIAQVGEEFSDSNKYGEGVSAIADVVTGLANAGTSFAMGNTVGAAIQLAKTLPAIGKAGKAGINAIKDISTKRKITKLQNIGSKYTKSELEDLISLLENKEKKSDNQSFNDVDDIDTNGISNSDNEDLMEQLERAYGEDSKNKPKINIFNPDEFEKEAIYEKMTEINPKNDTDPEDDDVDESFDVLNPGLNTAKIQEVLGSKYSNKTHDNPEPSDDPEDFDTSNISDDLPNQEKEQSFLDLFKKHSDMSSNFDMNNIMDFADYLADARQAKKDEQYLLSKSRGTSELDMINHNNLVNQRGNSGVMDMAAFAQSNDLNERNTEISKDYLNKKREALNKFRENRTKNQNDFLSRYENFIQGKEDLDYFKDVVSNNFFDPARNQKLALIQKAIESRKSSKANSEEKDLRNAIERTKLLGYVSNENDAELLGTDVGEQDQKTRAQKEKLAFDKYLEDHDYEQATEKQQQQMLRDYLKDSLAREKLEMDNANFERAANDKYDLGQESINARKYAAELGLQGKQDMGRFRKEGQMYAADIGKQRAVDVAKIGLEKALGTTKMKVEAAERMLGSKLENALTVSKMNDLTKKYGIDMKFKGLKDSLLTKEKINELQLAIKQKMQDKDITSAEKLKLADLSNALNIATLNAVTSKDIAIINKDKDIIVAELAARTGISIAQLNNASAEEIAKLARENDIKLEEIKAKVTRDTSPTGIAKDLADDTGLIKSSKSWIKKAFGDEGKIWRANLGNSVKYLASNHPNTWPVYSEKSIVTSKFGVERYIGGKKDKHTGIDIAASGSKVPIQSPVSGKIVQIVKGNPKNGFGNLIKIQTSHGFIILGHLQNVFNDGVEVGAVVNRGDLLSFMGNSGRSTGQHVHFECRNLKNKPVNPKIFNFGS